MMWKDGTCKLKKKPLLYTTALFLNPVKQENLAKSASVKTRRLMILTTLTSLILSAATDPTWVQSTVGDVCAVGNEVLHGYSEQQQLAYVDTCCVNGNK